MPSEPHHDRREDRGNGSRSTFESLREYTPYLTMGFQLAASVVVFFLIGVWADKYWDTSPWLKLLGLLLGTVGGFVKFFHTVADLEKKEESKPGKPPK